MTPPNVAIYNWIRCGFDFRGRSSRSDYWWTRLLVLSVNMVLLFMFASSIGPDGSEALLDWLASGSADLAELDMGPMPSLAKFSLTFVLIFGVLTFIPDLSIAWRRFHDLNKPGWLHLIFFFASGFVPLVALTEYVWFSFPGTPGPNRFGPDPLTEAADAA